MGEHKSHAASRDLRGSVDTRSELDLSSASSIQTERKKIVLFQEISRALSSGKQLEDLLELIMDRATELMDAERFTIYLLSDDRRELWSKVVQGGAVREIRLKVGEGVAGWVARSGETLNIPDAYVDKRFQPAVDLQTGYKTRTILCSPMRNTMGALVGVAQVLNKRQGVFTADDEDLLAALSSQAAMAIENAKLYHSMVSKNVELMRAKEKLQHRTYELNLLYEIEREMNESATLEQLLAKILERAILAVGAEAGTVALFEPGTDDLYFHSTAGPIAKQLHHKRIKSGTGVLGWVAKHGEPLIVNDPRSDDRHAEEFSLGLGVMPRHLISAPLIGDECLGAIELMDKAPTDITRTIGFSQTDLKLLTLIAGQVSKAIQLARAKEEREKEDRLAAIGTMLAGVLHDLKTPMTIISGYAQLMAQIDAEDQRVAYVDQIQHQFDLMSGMTREVLQFARGESHVLIRKVYLNKFLEEVETQLRHALATRGVTLRMDVSYTGVAQFDERKILRIAHNLARNAADAMPQGGEFSIGVKKVKKKVHFEFRDNGPGIPEALRENLFELFASGKKEGTGLGLAIVKKIVDEHDGELSYETETDVGTTFRVALPLSPRD